MGTQKKTRSYSAYQGFLASLTWLKFVICRLILISSTAPAASNNGACFKSGQNRLKNNHLEL